MLNGQWHTRDGAGLKVLKAAPREQLGENCGNWQERQLAQCEKRHGARGPQSAKVRRPEARIFHSQNRIKFSPKTAVSHYQGDYRRHSADVWLCQGELYIASERSYIQMLTEKAAQ